MAGAKKIGPGEAAYAVFWALVLIVFGGVGVCAGVFWMPSWRMRRSVEGAAARVFGGIAMAGGVALLVMTIYAACDSDDGHDGTPGAVARKPRKVRNPFARRRQAEEDAAAGYLDLNEKDGKGTDARELS